MTNTWPFIKNENFKIGIFGKYPCWAGNIKNQQIALNSVITKDTINQMQNHCVFNVSVNNTGSSGLSGYIVVDTHNNAYFSDRPLEFIYSLNLDSCQLKWSVRVGDLLNYTGNNTYSLRSTPTLYRLSNGKEALLFGTYTVMTNDSPYDGCYAVSLDISDGSLLWKTLLGNTNDSAYCNSHGFMIDQQFAFGGIAGGWSGLKPPGLNNRFVGRMTKININNGKLVNEWYTLPKYNKSINYASDGFYTGSSAWSLPAIIDDYVVFGTGNLFTIPRRVQQCMLGNKSAVPIEKVHDYNLCPTDMRENHLHWRCLEKDVYPDSLVILNKHSFNLKAAIPFGGVDAFNEFCHRLFMYENKTEWFNDPNCPKRIYPNHTYLDWSATGPDIDAVAIATYHDHDGKPYAAVGQKSGQFYVVDIETGDVRIIKKVGPWITDGGSSPFSMAVDEKHMIAIYSIVGTSTFQTRAGFSYKETMGDGTVVCGAGSVHAINLTTGHTIWQWINPYGKIDNLCNSTVYDYYYDITTDGTCERAFDGSDMLSAHETVRNVVTPPLGEDVIIPLDSELRADMIGPVTINNDMVFITTQTGDIFIHDIVSGDYIHRLQCPDYRFNQTHWNRAGIKSGISIFEDRILFYCGSNWKGIPFSAGNKLVSMKG
eukprot:378867_1